MTEQARDEHIDRITDEFRLLIDTAAHRAEEYLRDLAGEPSGACDRCPVCALLAVLRGEHTELSTRLTEQLADLVVSLREFLTEQHAHSTPSPEDPEPSMGKVQRIDVRRVTGSVVTGAPGAEEEPGC